MSNKKRKSSGNDETKKKTSPKRGMILLIAAALLVLLAVLFLRPGDPEEAPAVSQPAETLAPEETVPEVTILAEENSVNLGYGIYVTDFGKYTGAYMEDGSDEILSGVLMMIVKNDGDQDIQYAQITMDVNGQQAEFSITTLPVGERMVLLEQNRMAWDESVDYSAIYPKAELVAYFQESISTREDQLDIQLLDGALNITNISGEDIPGKITVYYKNAADDLLYGGITYTVSIEGGLEADELRQIMTNHASDTGSRIMFVTIQE